MNLGIYSDNVIASIVNPASYTSFSLVSGVGGGYAILPVSSADIDGKLLRFVIEGSFVYGASSPEFYISFGDPSTFPTGSTIIHSLPFSASSAGTYPFRVEVLAMYSSATGKIYSFGKTLDSDDLVYLPNVSSSTSSQSLSSATAYRLFLAVNFGANDPSNSVTVSKFEVSTVG